LAGFVRPLSLVRVAIAILFCSVVTFAVVMHALPWSVARLPLTAPIVLILVVALASIVWATIDVIRGGPWAAD
jgi:hypothetical protein